ncbi:DUF6443 domain-containing protein [Aquimarina sp. 2304DJ70-9]|uniref:DUF6443 domain-containing protein n=1 Tax=Aquimarina penaris TaxID=3231044 RepID=UPI0034635CF4
MNFIKYSFVIIIGMFSMLGYAQLGPSGPGGNPCADVEPNSKPWYRDADGDGLGNGSNMKCAVNKPSGYVSNAGDCNDNNSSLPRWYYIDADGDGYGGTLGRKACSSPSGFVANNNDCNDNNASVTISRPWYRDADGDGRGNSSVSTTACSKPSGYVASGGDCNDSDANVTLVKTWYRDADGDGHGHRWTTKTACYKPSGYLSSYSDYDDNNALITNIPPKWFYRDADGDGFGNPNNKTYRSVRPSGYVTNNTDCNDGNGSLHPNTIWYRDADGDSWGNKSVTKKQCTQPSGYVRNDDDYNDGNNLITNIAPRNFYRDADGDGFGNPSDKKYQSTKPSGYVTNASDCADWNPSLNPNTIWYRDADGDSWGNKNSTKKQCTRPSGYVYNDDDYNDGNNLITNIAPKNFYRDSDNDTFGNPNDKRYQSARPFGYVANGSDCNDTDASLNPNTVWYRDADGDSWGNKSVTTKNCTQPSGYVRNDDDYNDGTNLITNIAPRNFYQDVDGDTHGNPSIKTYRSVKPSGYVTNASDCNDSNSAIHPTTIWYADTDNDGFGDANVTKIQCTQPLGYVANKGDQCATIPGTVKGCEDQLDQLVNLSDTENYVFTQTFQKEITSLSEINKEEDVIEGVTYYDGLGRPKQQVAIKASPGASHGISSNELTMDWSTGQGSTGFFNQNGKTSENNRVNDVDPEGKLSLLWKCGNDVSNDADGGWNTDYFNVDKNLGYRYTVWVKRTGSNDGSTYHGTQNVNNLNGTANNNPYFWYGDLPELDTWYLLVGIIHPYQHGSEDSGISGVYDSNGNKVLAGNDFKWRDNTTNSRFRSYLYYSTDVNTNQFFWNPIVQKLDGYENSMTDLIQGHQKNSQDIVTHIEYDQYGRQAKSYLPFERQNTPKGSYKTVDMVNNINSYYQAKYADDFAGMLPEDVNAYSESVFEPSPLNRVLEQGAPGKAWKANPTSDDDHTIKFGWDTNETNEVVRFKVNFADLANTEVPTLVKDGFYAPNQLTVGITKDENWTTVDGDNHTVKEYKNKAGQAILKRTYNNNVPHDTYYVYDDFGNLTYVLPPKVTTNDGVSNNELVELCYQYHYDGRNRLIEKKIPGKGWEYIVYNKLDQPVMTQDALLKAQGVWLFTKYDTFGRVAYTGKLADNRDRSVIQTEATAYGNDLWVTRQNATTIGGVSMYYDDGGYPKVTTGEVLTINYYDDYNFDLHGMDKPGSIYEVATSNNVKSLPTGTKVRILGTNNWITTVTAYDIKGRAIWTGSRNHYLSTIDKTEIKLDFTGRVLETRTSHVKNGSTPLITIDKFEYDHMGRVLTQTQKINNQTEELIAANVYDELGQLISKNVGGISTPLSGSNGLQTVDYTYNVRGWLRGINDANTLGNDLFAFGINYNNVTENTYRADALYNGNISETIWKTANDNTKRSYSYSYDHLNRITDGFCSNGSYNLLGVTYDKMGNIISLNRNGYQGGSSFGSMDALSYTYDNGNKLLSVTDGGNKSYGFKDGTNTNDDFVYDVNGNMTIDRNKGITGITYNHLNLPTTVAISNTEGTGNISYIYDATGAKLKKIVTEGGSVTTEYAGNYVYKNGNLEFFNHAEGYVEKEADGYKYVYQFKDHLGNVRLSYTDADNNGIIEQSEIIEESNYFPFGLKQKGYNGSVSSLGNSTAQKFKYNGKELQEELGLNTYDYGARMYDPAIGRFMQIDPHSYSYPWATPYNYAFNNPALVIDPDGKDGVVSGSGTKKDPYVVTANYYHHGLSDKQAEGLQSAADAYNSKGKAHTIKDGDGNKVYVKFNIGVTKAESAEQASELATNDYVETSDGATASFGNVVTIGGDSKGDDLGAATRHRITLNEEKIANTLEAYPGGRESDIIKGTFIHEIGHNIGGSHGDPGSTMQSTKITNNIPSGTIGGSGDGTFNYSNPSVSKNGIRAIMGRVNMVPGSINSNYLSDKENKQVNQAIDPGSSGRLKSTN